MKPTPLFISFAACLTIGLSLSLAQSETGNTEAGKELLNNGSFADGLTGWKTNVTQEYRDVGTKPPQVRRGTDGPEVVASVVNKGAPHYVNISQPVDLVNGKVYKLSAEVKVIGEGHGAISGWSTPASSNCGIGFSYPAKDTWQHYESYFIARDVPDSEPPAFVVCFAGQAGNMAVRKLSLTLTDKTSILPTDRIPVANDTADTAPLVDLSEVIDEFEADSEAATAKYKDKPVTLSASMVAVGPGPNAASWMFSLEFGRAKLVGLKAELIENQAAAIAGNLKDAQARFASMKRSPKWAEFPADVKKGHVMTTFPTLKATGWISGYRDGVLLIGRSQDLVIQNP